METKSATTPEVQASPREESPAGLHSRSGTWTRRILLAVFASAVTSGGWYGAARWKERQFERACRDARKQRDWRSLRKIAREWIQWDPDSSAGWWRAAEASEQLEDLEDMAVCLGQISSEDPKYPFALALKANLEWTALNRPLDALKTSLAAIDRDPRLVEVHSRIISFYAMTLQRVPMLKAIRRALEVGAEPKESYSYLIVSDILTFSNSDDMNGRWLAACPDEPTFKVGLGVQTALNLAQTAVSDPSEKVLEASRAAKEQIHWFLEALPGNPVLLAYLMHQAYLRSDISEMEQLLLQVSDQASEDHMVWVYRGWYHTQIREFEQAKNALSEALRIHPISPLAWHENALLLRTIQSPETENAQRIAAYGRELRSQVLLLSSAASITAPLILQLQSYAESCGDILVAKAAATRLQNFRVQ